VWDVLTATPKSTLKGHKSWVMAVGFSPDGKLIASGGMEGNVILWDVDTGLQKGRTMTGHKKWITSLAWEPMCSAQSAPRVASSSKDGDVRIWDTARNCLLLTLAGHTNAVKCVKWGSENLIYSASADRSIKVWETTQGKLVRTLDGHAHWVNTLSLNTEYVLRTGPFDHNGDAPEDEKARGLVCQEKIKKVTQNAEGRELLVSGSDDFTLFLWQPTRDKKPIMRLTGHQQPVNFVQFSPDGALIASASFDNSVRLWNGVTGSFIAVFRGHVQSVYQVCWSGDSRLLCSSSKDSTMKVWDIRTRKLKFDLPGHSDEVFAVDWAPNGQRVASGGKDKVLKLWQS
jgi:ribosome assembly protein 4